MLLCISVGGLAQPVANFSAQQVNGCAPFLVQFSDLSTNNPLTYFWDFGNGNTSTLKNPSATFVSPGSYTIKLSVNNGAGSDSKTLVNYITVYPRPTVSFGLSRNVGCTPLSVQFRDSSTSLLSSIVAWSWDLGNGNTSNQQNPSSVYTQIRTHDVSLMVTDGNGCSNSLLKRNYVTVQAVPIVNISASNVFGCELPFNTQFNAQVSPPGMYQYLWDFGNGSTSLLPNPPAVYNAYGNFTTQLRLVNAAQCTVNVVRPNLVQVADIVPDFRLLSSSNLCESSFFTILNTSNFNARVFTNIWRLNDSVVSQFKDLQVKKLKPGNYSVSLQVSSGSCSTSVTKPLFLSVQTGPKTDFYADTNLYCKTPAEVKFIDSSSHAVAWFWDFGNGQTSTLKNPSVTYNNMGDYTIKLVTTHSNGCTDTLIKEAYIKVMPVYPNPTFSAKAGCPPLDVRFGILDTNLIKFDEFIWTIGRNGDSVVLGKDAFYTYRETGVYYVTLTAKNPRGCTVTIRDSILVGGNVHVDFMAEKRVYCNDEQPVVFTNTSINPGLDVIYNWDYGDTSRVLKNMGNQVIFKDTGLFTIKLEAIFRGCKTILTREDYIRINAPITKFTYKQPHCDKRQVVFENKTKGGHLYRWDFGVGDSSFFDTLTEFEEFVPFFYDSNGTYFVKLEVTDTVSGCVDTYRDTLNINFNVEPNFTISSMLGCAPMAVRLQNKTVSTVPMRFCLFKIGDIFYGGDSINIVLRTPGKYAVSMYVTDHQNCVFAKELKDSIEIIGAKMRLLVSPLQGCAPLPISVIDSSVTDLPVKKRIWYWGNGDSTSLTQADSLQFKYTYTQPPLIQDSGFNLTLVIEDTLGCRFSQGRNIRVLKPRPDFTVHQSKNCALDTFTFTPIADKQIGLVPLTFFWELDGQTTISRKLTKVYNKDTSILIKLMAFDAYGCIDTMVKKLSFKIGPPQVDFDAFPKRINCPGPPVYFSDYTSAGSTPIQKWDWSFSDGVSSNLQNPSRVFLLAGSYSATLTITDSIGCLASKTIPNIVVIGGPSGQYAINPLNGCAPLKVNFEMLTNEDNRITWDFGDGNLDSTAITSHVYTRTGKFVPHLTITDKEGCKIGFEPKDTITILAKPEVDFKVSKLKSCLGDELVLTGEVIHTLPIQNYKWNIDGNILSSLGPHTYQSNRVGAIPVWFEASDSYGCVGTKLDSFAFTVFKDEVSPAAPAPYRASVVSDEAVDFHFAPNTEADLESYLLRYNWDGFAFRKSRLLTDTRDTLQLFTQLNTLNYTYSFAVLAKDVCGNWSEPSRTQTTMELKASGIENAIVLNWLPYIGWDTVETYHILRLNTNNQVFEEIAVVGGHTLFYVDSLLACFTKQHYKIQARFKGIVSNSDTAAAIPIFVSHVPQTQAIRATVVNNKEVFISWYPRTHKFPFYFVVLKTSADPNRPAERIVLGQNDTSYQDKAVDVQQYAYEYVVQLVDACGGVGEVSNKAKSILLQMQIGKNDKLSEDALLSWSAYQKWYSGVDRYELYFMNDSLGTKELIATRKEGDTLWAKHAYVSLNQDQYCYEILAYKQDSNWVQSLSNRVCMETLPRLFAPNAFTCNNDNLNDGFLVQGIFVKQFELQIFNRWGVLVFESNDMYAPWDGKYNGVDAPSDVYVYIATGYGRNGKFKTIKGNVTLLR